MTKPKTIKAVDGYSRTSDADIVVRASAVLTSLTGNAHFTALPVDLATIKTNIDSFAALVAEAEDGGKKVVAEKNKQRQVVIKMLRLLSRYVEVNSNDDMSIFTSSGFVAATRMKTPPAPLPMPVIRSVDHGAISGELVVQFQAIPKALSYELRWGQFVNGAVSGPWTSKVVTAARPPIGIQGLTPGTVYAFQVRAQGKLGWTDWTDSSTFMCT
jgi:hypothetical protein